MKDLSIIIISYNTRELTQKCIETTINSLSYDPQIKAEMIIVDNGSKDGSVQMLKENQKSKIKNQNNNVKFKIILSTENLGYAKANNLAEKQAEGKYLLFLNSDIEVIDNAIPQLFNFFKQKETSFQFLGGKLLNKNLSLQPSCGPFYSLPVIFGALFLRGDYWGLTRWSPDKIKKVDWVSGACLLTKKEYFEKSGRFDEQIFMYMDEIDLLYRAKKHGFKVGFYPRARFIHMGSASSYGRTQPILQVYRGFLYFYQKHHPQFELKILKCMLQLKASLSVFVGSLLRNDYLIKTYEDARKIVSNSR